MVCLPDDVLDAGTFLRSTLDNGGYVNPVRVETCQLREGRSSLAPEVDLALCSSSRTPLGFPPSISRSTFDSYPPWRSRVSMRS